MYQFDPKIAQSYGVNEAIIYQNIVFRCTKSRANNKNYFDGKYRTYNSKKAFADLFPFWTERYIKTILDNMFEQGLLHKGCYNENKWDKTNWYTPCDQSVLSIGQNKSNGLDDNGPLDRTESVHSNRRNPSTHYIKTDINTDNKQQIINTDIKEKHFDDFWVIYPCKKGKESAKKNYKYSEHDLIIQGVKNYIKEQTAKKNLGSYVPQWKYASTFINQRCWEEYLDDTATQDLEFEAIYQEYKADRNDIDYAKERKKKYYFPGDEEDESSLFKRVKKRFNEEKTQSFISSVTGTG